MVDRIVFVSNHGESLPLVYRLKKMGIFCPIYLHTPQCQHLYDGLINTKVDLKGLRKALLNTKIIIFDTIKRNEKKRHDGALLKTFGLKANVKELFGAVADKLKKDYKVFGGSEATGEIELDRFKGEELARKAGLLVPETYRFKNLNEGIKFLKARKNRWVFKPYGNLDLDLTYVEKYPGELLGKMEYEFKPRIGDSVEYILQKVVDGIELSTEGWFDGKNWLNFNHTIEDKKMMNGNLGVAVGSQNNTVWLKKNPNGLLMPEFKKMSPFLKDVGYKGPIDINAIINEKDKKPYFLEWIPRIGYDAFYCLMELVKNPLVDFWVKDFNVGFYDGYASSARVTIPPFPYADEELLEDMAMDTIIKGRLDDYPQFWGEDVYLKDGKLACAGSDGIIGVMASRGNGLGNAWGNVYRELNGLKVGNYLQFRTDGLKRPEKAIRTLKEWRIDIE